MFRNPRTKLVAIRDLSDLSRRLRADSKKIVSTNGCFDLLHLGHTDYLARARELGDVLVVGVNSDASVKKLKGPDRPICDETTRALQLAALEAVDYVVIFPDDTPVSFLKSLAPHLHVKGGDYEGKEMPERATVEGGGGEIVLVPLVPGFSTTKLLERLQK